MANSFQGIAVELYLGRFLCSNTVQLSVLQRLKAAGAIFAVLENPFRIIVLVHC